VKTLVPFKTTPDDPQAKLHRAAAFKKISPHGKPMICTVQRIVSAIDLG
jgi:DNA-binding phage protein